MFAMNLLVHTNTLIVMSYSRLVRVHSAGCYKVLHETSDDDGFIEYPEHCLMAEDEPCIYLHFRMCATWRQTSPTIQPGWTHPPAVHSNTSTKGASVGGEAVGGF